MSDVTARLHDLLAPWRAPVAFDPQLGDSAKAMELLDLVAEQLAGPGLDTVDRDFWAAYLEHTRHPDYLMALPDAAARNRWAETTFTVIEGIGFDLGDLLAQRERAHPTRVLFQELSEASGGRWDYARIRRRVRSVAALLWRDGPRPELAPGGSRDQDGPRVALLTANSIASACCDLACLTHDIFVTPLNTHFSVSDLTWIFNRLRITVAICDDPARLDQLLEIRASTDRPFDI